MKYNYLKKRRVVAALLTVCFLMQQSMIVPAIATDITGITGINGVYDINPGAVNGDVGFRQYKNFNLSAGDIANLIFKYSLSIIEISISH